jgi:hypothetical protein
MVTTSTTVGASWMKAGFDHCKRDEAFYLLVNDEKIRDSPEFSEIWRINFLIEALSAGRRQQKRRFMNQKYFKGAYQKIIKREGFN